MHQPDAFHTNIPGPRDTRVIPPAAVRMKVAELLDAFAPAGKKVMRANRWDGQNLGTRDFIIAPVGDALSAVGDEVFAMVVSGGTGFTCTGSTSGAVRSVIWRSLSDGLGQPQYQYQFPWATTQNKWSWALPLVAHPPLS